MRNYFNKRIFITASIGNTHDGNLKMAKKLIVMCNKAKVDAVKFKKKDPELYSDNKIYYEPFGEITKKELCRKLDFSKDEYDELDEFCKYLSILWYVSLYDLNSLEWMERNYSLSLYKIPGCKLKDINFIKEVAKTKKLIIMSTGMSTIKEVDKAIENFLVYNKNLVIMHSSSIYPALPGDINMRVMRTLHKHYKLHTGYDSHDIGDYLSYSAVGMGAKAIEKHVTLNKSLQGHQHSIALEPDELEKLVLNIRNIEKSLGGAHKRLLDREIPYRTNITEENEEDLKKLERMR